jgi:serine/threonine protein kinase
MSEALFVLKEGWLTKQGGVFKTWHKRWFSIVGRKLFYSKERGKGEKGNVTLGESIIVDFAPETKKKNAFKIITPTRVYYIVAKDEEERASWMTTLKSVIDGTHENFKLTAADVTILNTISETNVHKICEVSRNLDSNIKYIMKTYKKELLDERVIQEQLDIREQFLKRTIPYVTPLKFIIQSDTEISLISELRKFGSLYDKLEDEGKISEEKATIYAAQIITALELLQKDRLFYYDLKTSSILLDSQGNLSLIDPGIKDISKSLVITEYTAPELIPDEGTSMSIGAYTCWYNVGLILYELICGLPPYWEPEEEALKKAIKTAPLLFPHHVSETTKSLCRKLLDRNIATRLGSGEAGVEDIKKHPFFASVCWEAVAAKTVNVPLI